jgi:hypothetical protein
VGPKRARFAAVFDSKRRARTALVRVHAMRQSRVRTRPWFGNEPYVANWGNTTGTPPRIGECLSSALFGLRKSRSSSPQGIQDTTCAP